MPTRSVGRALLCLLAGALAGCAAREPCGRVWKGRASAEQQEGVRSIGRAAHALASLEDVYQLGGRITRVNGREVYHQEALARLARLNRYSQTRRTPEGVDFRYHPSDTSGVFYTFPDVLFEQLGIPRSAAESLALQMDRTGIIAVERQPGAVIMTCAGAFDGSYGVLYESGDVAAADSADGRRGISGAYRDRAVGSSLYAWGRP